MVGECVAVLAYLRASPDGPHRTALLVIAVISACVGSPSFFVLRTIARQMTVR